jgi:hypothetical protein
MDFSHVTTANAVAKPRRARIVPLLVRGRPVFLDLDLVMPAACSPQQETVASFAEQLRKKPAVLLDQLREAGVHKENVDCIVTDADKSQLLTYLQRMHGTIGDRKKITLKKKSTDFKSAPPSQQPKKEKDASKDRPKVILVGNMGRGMLSDEWSRMFLMAYVDAFHEFPGSHEFDSLRFVVDRIKALKEAILAGEPEDLLEAIRYCFDGVKPGRSAKVLINIVLQLLQPLFVHMDNVQLAIAWERVTTASAQVKLKAGCRRTAHTDAATAAWRLRRRKRWLPACVATINLV